MKKTNKKKKNDQGTKLLCLFIVVVAFTLAFVVLINKQQNDSYENDISGNMKVTPLVGERIVAKDMKAIYPKYYVVFINDDDEYSIYTYNYYETISQYNLEFNRLIDSIVDYNSKDKMIRCIYSRGYGTYDEVLNNLSYLVDSDNLLIY